LRLKFRDAVFELMDMRSGTLLVDPFFCTFWFIRTWQVIGMAMTTNRFQSITFRLLRPTGIASSEAPFAYSTVQICSVGGLKAVCSHHVVDRLTKDFLTGRKKANKAT
jgi:hypothetical protein